MAKVECSKDIFPWNSNLYVLVMTSGKYSFSKGFPIQISQHGFPFQVSPHRFPEMAFLLICAAGTGSRQEKIQLRKKSS